MKRFKVTTRIQEVGSGPERLETSTVIIAADAVSAARVFADLAAKMAPKDGEATDAD